MKPLQKDWKQLKRLHLTTFRDVQILITTFYWPYVSGLKRDFNKETTAVSLPTQPVEDLFKLFHAAGLDFSVKDLGPKDMNLYMLSIASGQLTESNSS